MSTKPPTGSDPPADPPSLPRAGLARLERTLRQRLRHGCQRAVFAVPGEASTDGSGSEGVAEAEPEVVDFSDLQPWDESAVATVIEQARRCAMAGRVKQVYWLDERTRLRVDARHGHGKIQTLDEATVRKMMGGKDRALRPDRSATFLRVIGISNADGTISPKKAKKYKQINHFVDLCRPIWERLVADRPGRRLEIVDLGCGNGYLTFALAEALRLAGIEANITGVDVREDVVTRANLRAAELDLPRLRFVTQTIAQYSCVKNESDAGRELRVGDDHHDRDVSKPRPLAGASSDAPVANDGVDLVMALHACDTATDEALAFAIHARARAVLVAPCCQAELATQLERGAGTDRHLPAGALVKLPLLRREYAALLTDALRADALAAMGYRVDTLEFVGSEHTPKNLLLRALWTRRPSLEGLEALMERGEALGVRPTLLTLLAGQLPDAPERS